jgi:hypothetical protein
VKSYQRRLTDPLTSHATDCGIRETSTVRPSMVDHQTQRSAQTMTVDVHTLRYVEESHSTSVQIQAAEHMVLQ